MNRSFKKVAFLFFIGFGAFYLTADFLLHQGNIDSDTLMVIYHTFDMPFFFCAGMYGLASLQEFIKTRFEGLNISVLFWILAIAWTGLLLYLNLGYESLL